ncbi:MAG: mevalonate kinase [Nitrososphaerota archaeon]|nr:mevalonate kinase [Nitrososphaerota archaeon]
MKESASASAPGKVILFGEHFVVYGKPALATAIDMRVTVKARPRRDARIFVNSIDVKVSGYCDGDVIHICDGDSKAGRKLEPIFSVVRHFQNVTGKSGGVELEIKSEIPASSGLGSSAAVSVASASALDRLFNTGLSRDEIFKISMEAEKIVHGNPSGIDPAASIYGGFILYQKGKGVERLDLDIDLPIIIGDTQMERSTGEMVNRVSQLRTRYPALIDKIVCLGEEIVTQALEALKNRNLEALGEIMNINHSLLNAIGVSNMRIERLVQAARDAGALGAKLTGAGGGGCIIALGTRDKISGIAEAIQNAGGRPYITKRSMDGVRFEE